MSDKRVRPAAPHRAGQGANRVMEARNALEQAEQARRQGKLLQAEKMCKAILARFPDYVAALHTIGLVYADGHKYREALPFLIQASMLNPHDHAVLTILSGVYLRLGAGTAALRALEQARALKPDDADILATYGEVCREEREFEAGAQALRAVSKRAPALHGARFALGNCLTHLGDLKAAAGAFEALIETGQCSIDVLYALSQLPARVVKSDILALCDELEASTKAPTKEFDCLLALTRGAAHDQAGNHALAWKHFVAGNRPVHAAVRKVRRQDRDLEAFFLNGVRNARFPEVPAASLKQSGKPVSLFIMGASRSGKTTLEKLLASHAKVKRGYENPIVENAVRRAFQSAALPTRERIFELPPPLDQKFRQFYGEELARRAGSARVFTNTHPAHIVGALRLAAVLPDARFVFVKRDINDMALRIFMKRYISGNSYAYDLNQIFAHVRWYEAMIDAVSGIIPDRSLVLAYEDVIADPASAVAAVAKLCAVGRTRKALPKPGDDRGCAAPYAEFMLGATGG